MNECSTTHNNKSRKHTHTHTHTHKHHIFIHSPQFARNRAIGLRTTGQEHRNTVSNHRQMPRDPGFRWCWCWCWCGCNDSGINSTSSSSSSSSSSWIGGRALAVGCGGLELALDELLHELGGINLELYCWEEKRKYLKSCFVCCSVVAYFILKGINLVWLDSANIAFNKECTEAGALIDALKENERKKEKKVKSQSHLLFFLLLHSFLLLLLLLLFC